MYLSSVSPTTPVQGRVRIVGEIDLEILSYSGNLTFTKSYTGIFFMKLNSHYKPSLLIQYYNPQYDIAYMYRACALVTDILLLINQNSDICSWGYCLTGDLI